MTDDVVFYMKSLYDFIYRKGNVIKSSVLLD